MMSGSDTGAAVMTSTEPFPAAKPPVAAPQPVIQTMRLAYSPDGTPVYRPVATSPPSYPSAGGGNTEAPAAAPVMQHNLNVPVGEPMRKKRGRPRKYGPDGNMALAVIPPPGSSPAPHSAGGTFSPSPPPFSGGGFTSPVSSASSFKKARGRPPGSSKKQQMEALGSAGLGFTPHVINVKAGEDVSSKIMSFSQNGPRAVCILSANGAISNVTLRQAATSGGTATYEGRFDILSLSGSFLLTEVGGQRSRTGGLSVSLAGPDGRVLGGSVAGLLTAASPVQVIVGSFVVDGRKDPKPAAIHVEPLSAAPKLAQSGVPPPPPPAAVVHSPQSHGSLSESSGGSGSPLNQSTGACNNNNNNNNLPQAMSSMPWR